MEAQIIYLMDSAAIFLRIGESGVLSDNMTEYCCRHAAKRIKMIEELVASL
jgi:hypothetical protein